MRDAIGVAEAVFAFLALTAGAATQDGAPPTPNEAEEALRVALEKTVEKGGIVLAGNLERGMEWSVAVLDPAARGTGAEIEGDFSARVARDGSVAVRIENEEGWLEIYCKSGKRVQRQAWGGGFQPSVSQFAGDVARLLDLKRLQDRLREGTKVAAVPGRKIGGVPCRAIRADLPAKFMSEKGAPANFQMMEVREIGATFHVGKDDGLLRGMEVMIARAYSSVVRMEANGQGVEEEGPNPGGFDFSKMRFPTTYTFTIRRYEPQPSVEVPKEIEKLLGA